MIILDKKKIGIIIVILAVLIVGAYQFVYVPYHQEQCKINFNAGLKNASQIELDLNKSVAEFNQGNYTDLTEFSTQSHKLMDEVINPKVDEEIKVLNETLAYADGNKTKEQYINYQIERLTLEKESTAKIIEDSDKVLNSFNSGQYLQALDDSSSMENNTNANSVKIKTVDDNIKALLNANPDLNQTLTDLNLYDEFYGIYTSTAE